MRMNWEKYGIKAPYGNSGNRKVFCPQCHEQRRDKRDKSLSIKYFAPNVMSNAVTSGTKAFQSTLKRASLTATIAGSQGVRLKKSRGRKKTARGGTQPQ